MALVAAGDRLDCPAGHSVLVHAGIPRFVSSEWYAAAFGLQWKRFRLTQLDSHTRTSITRDRLRRCFGDALWNALDGAEVLECGCGAGRFTEVLLDRGARVTSIDLSTAVEANADNFPPDERHRIAQADILDLPFAPGQYDVVVGLGVVQHTPDPERTVRALAAMVRPGGFLVVDHYTYSISWFTKTAPLVRQVLKRLSPASAMRWTERIVGAFWPLHLRLRRSRLATIALTRLSPVLCYLQVRPELSDEHQREWAVLDTHDSLTDCYKHLRTRGQIRGLLEALGFEVLRCETGGNGVEALARRPAAKG